MGKPGAAIFTGRTVACRALNVQAGLFLDVLSQREGKAEKGRFRSGDMEVGWILRVRIDGLCEELIREASGC